MLQGDLLPTLVQVRRGGLRGKSIQAQIIELFGKHGEGKRGGLFFADLEIHLAERIETLQSHVAAQRRETIDRSADEAVFEGLGERDAIVQQGAGKGRSWGEGFYANDVAIPVSSPRNQVLYGEMKLVEIAGAGFYTRNRAGELSIFRIVRV